MRQNLPLEKVWLDLNLSLRLNREQRQKLRPHVLAAIKGRAAALQELGAPNSRESYERLMGRFAEVRDALEKQFADALSPRQRRVLDQVVGQQSGGMRPKLVEDRPRPPRGDAAFVVTDTATGSVQVFDFVHVNERSAGYRVRFAKGAPYQGMTAANIIFEYNDRFVMAEPLAFDLYRRTGQAASLTDFVRLTLNGHLVGYHLLFEPVNGSFLRRNKLNTDGDLYKLIWYGGTLEGQHEKQDHPNRDHSDLAKLVAELEATSGDAQWDVIQRNFNVDQVANYFAVNMVLSHWDGFFNNYFTYHDRKGSGRWEMYPWDQDKTWGFHDASANKVFFDMPLTFGAAGDTPPGGGKAGGFNPGSWWRPGGFFSKPLLANPTFRKRYLTRIRQILDETYTEQTYFPIIDQMAARLRPEVPIRAKALGRDPEEALKRLDRNVASLKEHLVKRRAFLLDQAELKQLKP